MIARDSDDQLPASESSSWATSRNPINKPARHECESCNERKGLDEVFGTSCGHHYCHDCLNTLFRLSTVDETLFPPRCCRQEIPLLSAEVYLSANLVLEFLKKSLEYRTMDRTYCSQPTCSQFIPANIKGEAAVCATCSTVTCTICKGGSHIGDCPQDIGIQLTLATAQEQGWQRCLNCQSMVELDVGCNHITWVVSLTYVDCLTSAIVVDAEHNSATSAACLGRPAIALYSMRPGFWPGRRKLSSDKTLLPQQSRRSGSSKSWNIFGSVMIVAISFGKDLKDVTCAKIVAKYFPDSSMNVRSACFGRAADAKTIAFEVFTHPMTEGNMEPLQKEGNRANFLKYVFGERQGFF